MPTRAARRQHLARNNKHHPPARTRALSTIFSGPISIFFSTPRPGPSPNPQQWPILAYGQKYTYMLHKTITRPLSDGSLIIHQNPSPSSRSRRQPNATGARPRLIGTGFPPEERKTIGGSFALLCQITSRERQRRLTNISVRSETTTNYPRY